MSAEPFRYLPSEIPEGRSGEWVVEKFVLAERTQPDERPEWFRHRAGRYTRLRQASTVFMTDLYDEWWTQRGAMRQACRRGGEVLVTGLGLGLVVESILRAPGSSVKRVSVLERSPDVIRLAGPHLRALHGDRVEIFEGDAFTWQPPPGRHFSVIWHDIWPNPHEPGVFDEVAVLERRFAAFCDWQGSWVTQYREVERA